MMQFIWLWIFRRVLPFLLARVVKNSDRAMLQKLRKRAGFIRDYGQAIFSFEDVQEIISTLELGREKQLALEADAARYRYLRSRDLDTIHQGGIFAGEVPANVVINGDYVDAAIDAARGAAPADFSLADMEDIIEERQRRLDDKAWSEGA
jgi:hypothetical protein